MLCRSRTGCLTVVVVLGCSVAARAAETPAALTTTVAVGASPESRPEAAPVLGDLPRLSRSTPDDYFGRHVPFVSLTAGGLSVRGADTRETALYLDDVRVTRLVLPLGMLERIDLHTAGYGVQLADVTGGAIAARTRTGSASLQADVGIASQLRGKQDDDLASATLATPLAGERLSLLVGAEAERERWPAATDPTGFYPDTPAPGRNTVRAGAQLTWRPADVHGTHHRITTLVAGSFGRQDNLAQLGLTEMAQPRLDRRDLLASGRWQAQLGSRLTARAQLLYEHDHHRQAPLVCADDGEGACNEPITIQRFGILPGLQARDLWRQALTVDRALEAVVGVDGQLSVRPWLRSSVRLTSRVRAAAHRHRVAVPGNEIFESNGLMIDTRTTYFSNDPRLDGVEQFGAVESHRSVQRMIHALEAPLVLSSQLHVVPGLALVTGRATMDRGDRLSSSALTPGIGVAWQPIPAYQLWLRAGSHQRVDADLAFVSAYTTGFPVARWCRSDQLGGFTRECTFSGGPSGVTLGLPCGPVSTGSEPCHPALRFPRGWEHTVGAGGEVTRGVTLNVDLVASEIHGRWTAMETNRVWNEAGGTNLGGGFRNGRASTVQDVSNHARAVRRHRGIITGLGAHSSRLQLGLTHAWSRLWWGGMDVESPIRDLLYDDGGRHHVYLQARAAAGAHLSIAALYGYAQGAALDRYYRNGAYGDSSAQVGVNPGANINDPGDDRPSRDPATQQLDVQLRWHLQPLLGARVDLYIDALHLMSNRRAIADPTSLATVSTGEDRGYRVGLEYRH